MIQGSTGRHPPWPALLLTLLIILNGISLLVWLRIRSPPYTLVLNEVLYVDIADRIYSLTPALLNLRSLIIASAPYPPLIPGLAALLWLAIGRSYVHAVMVNALFIPVLVVSTYVMGREMRSERCGIIAAFAVSGFPLLYTMQRYFHLDFALTALVALTGALYLSSRNFSRRGPTLAMGTAMALAMLTKLTAGIFLLAPAVHALMQLTDRKKRGTVVLSLMLGAMLAAAWYLPNAGSLLSFSGWSVGPSASAERPAGLSAQLLFYPSGLIFGQLTPLVAIVTALLLARLLWRKQLPPFLPLWVASALALLALLGPMSWRYSLPVLPAIAVILAMGIESLPPLPRSILTGLLILLMVTLHITLSFSPGRPDFPQVKSTDFEVFPVHAIPFGPIPEESTYQILSQLAGRLPPNATILIAWTNPERDRVAADVLEHVISFTDLRPRMKNVSFEQYYGCLTDSDLIGQRYVLSIGKQDSASVPGEPSSNPAAQCNPMDIACRLALNEYFLSERGNHSPLLQVRLQNSRIAEFYDCAQLRPLNETYGATGPFEEFSAAMIFLNGTRASPEP